MKSASASAIAFKLALDRLVASSLRLLEHCNQHHDDDRHDRRAGSQPRVRETSQKAQSEPNQHGSDANDEEGPAADRMHGHRGDLVESSSLSADLARRELPEALPFGAPGPRPRATCTRRSPTEPRARAGHVARTAARRGLVRAQWGTSRVRLARWQQRWLTWRSGRGRPPLAG